MKIKTSDLAGHALNYSVALALGYQAHHYGLLNGEVKVGWWFSGHNANPNCWIALDDFSPCALWEQGGPIIERERINVCTYRDGWDCYIDSRMMTSLAGGGDTALVAAMRCFVALKLGRNVEIPEELLS